MLALSRSLRPFTLLLCWLVAASAACAQTPAPTPKGPIQMALSSPFALTERPLVVTAKSGRWFPVAVTLSNTGDPVQGEVRLRLTGAGNFDFAPNDFYTPVDLPSNSNKVVWLYGRMERPNINGFEVTFSGRGFRSIAQRIPLQEADPEQRLILTIADTDDGLAAMLKSLKGQAMFRGGRAPQLNPGLQPIRAIQTGHENVPDRWIGFDGADNVVLGDFVHASLVPKQLDALRGWVQTGGNLIVVGGNNAGRLNTSPLRDLWPVSANNSAPASPSEVGDLVKRYVPQPKNGADRLGGAPVVVVRASLQAGAQLKDGTAGAPLFAIGDRGAGRVTFLAYNPGQPPFVGWSGQGELWRDIFLFRAEPRRLDAVDVNFLSYGNNPGMTGGYYNGNPYANGQETATSDTGQLLNGLASAPQLKMPPVSQIAWFLALYVFFLVPVNYAILRLVDRRELAWVTIPLIVAGFSIWAYSAALTIRGKAILTRQIDIVQSSLGSNAGRTDSMLWLFSPKPTTYDLSCAGQSAVISDYANESSGKQGAFSILEPGDEGSFKAQAANVWMWTDRPFNAQSVGQLGKGVALSGSTLSNNLPLDLQGAVWVQDGRVWSLGDIKKGGSAVLKGEGKATSGADLPGAIANASNLPQIFDSNTISSSIPGKALNIALGNDYGKLNAGALLVAWGKTPIAPIAVENARGRDVTLWVFRAPKVGGALASRSATIARTSFEPFVQAPNGTPIPNNGNYGRSGGYAFYDATLPAQNSLTLKARGLGIGTAGRPARPASKPGAPGPRRAAQAAVKGTTAVHFEVFDARLGQWQRLEGTLKRDKSPAGGWNFSAPVDAQMARSPDRLLRLRVKLDNARASVSNLQIG